MAKRTKKPPVKPEKRLEWLHRVEREGETLSHIAEADNFDLRTVRKHIEQAKLERDVQLARKEVLRDALVAHYHDLLEVIRGIESHINSEEIMASEMDHPLMSGLRQHMPRSPLWKNLKKWNQTLTELSALETSVSERLKKELSADTRLYIINLPTAHGATLTAVDVLIFQMKQWVHGLSGLIIKEDIKLQKASQGKVNLSYGDYHLGETDEESVGKITDLIKEYEQNIKTWDEYFQLHNLAGRLGRLKKSISATVTLVLLRRILPGRCKFCPV